MKKIILLKLGGSFITDKTKPFTLMKKNIEQIAIELKKAYELDPTLSLIIGTGAGSFGHYSVKKFNIEVGLKTDSQRYGFCYVHHVTQKLNQIVLAELLDKGLKAFSLHPSSMLIAQNGKPVQFFYKPIIELVKTGVIPVIHGDVVFDKDTGSIIYSVEDIFSELIQQLHILGRYRFLIIHATSTDGVFDEKNQTIPLITKSKFSKLQRSFFQTKGYDVTGGMRQKVETCIRMAEVGVESIILNGAKKIALKTSC